MSPANEQAKPQQRFLYHQQFGSKIFTYYDPSELDQHMENGWQMKPFPAKPAPVAAAPQVPQTPDQLIAAMKTRINALEMELFAANNRASDLQNQLNEARAAQVPAPVKPGKKPPAAAQDPTPAAE